MAILNRAQQQGFFRRFPTGGWWLWVRFLIEFSVIVPALFAYHLVRAAVEGRAEEAFIRAIQIIHLEESLGIFWEVSLQQLVLGERLLVDLLNAIYIWGHMPFIAAVALWIYFLHRSSYSLYRNAFLISGGIGLVIFALLPVMPPRFLPEWGFVDTVTEHSEAYRLLQPPAFVNQYAAMPSLHFGWNLLLGIAIIRESSHPIGRLIGALSPLIVFAGIVLTANHYILDAVAGGLVALLGLAIALFLREHFVRKGIPLGVV